jgi:Ca-activated chloride channel family protein
VTTPSQPAVLLVSAGNPVLAAAIQATTTTKLVTVTPGQYEGPLGEESLGGSHRFDVVVFDRHQPSTAPSAGSLFVATVPPWDTWARHPDNRQTVQRQPVLTWKRDHPLMDGVSFDTVWVAGPSLSIPDTAQVLATGLTGPLIASITTGRSHHVIVGFDPLESNWPLQVGFPIFIHNAMRWLGTGGHMDAGLTRQPGQDLAVPVGGFASYEGPFTPWGGITHHTPSQPPFRRVGVYRATGKVRPPWGRLGVSLLNRAESNLQPVQQPPFVGPAPTAIPGRGATVQHEVWPWFITAALAALMAEWVVYTRGIGR